MVIPLPWQPRATPANCRALSGLVSNICRLAKIAITPGSSLGFVIALSAFDKGDRIAIASPGYPAYFNSMLALGITPQLYPRALMKMEA